MNTLLTQLNHTNVRQLLWCIASPELAHGDEVTPLQIPLDSALIDWLMGLDQKPDTLMTFLDQNTSKRLGLYFEKIWQFYLMNGPGWRLLNHNLQIIENKKTLGELDILASNPSKDCLHIELAVKFYLLHPDKSGVECAHWLGPQSRDRLDIKLKTLNEKQFPILHHPQTQAAINRLKIPQPIHQKLALKGYLFSPWQKDYSLPSKVNPCCLLGEWLHQTDVTNLTQTHENWIIASKPQWLGPLKLNIYNNQESTLSKAQVHNAVYEHFAGTPNNHALMLIKVAAKSDHFVELKRYFIVSDNWPNI